MGECLLFSKGSSGTSMCMKAHGKVFGVWSREETINEEILSGTPSSKCVTFVQMDFWENKRDIDNQHGVELDLLAANQPYSPMINRWCCEQHRIQEIGLLPLHVDYLFKTGYYKEPESFPTRDFPRNIWRKENIRVKMREEASKWPRWICPFRIEE
jgi:hypothetical protein